MKFQDQLYAQLQAMPVWGPNHGYVARAIERDPCCNGIVPVLEQYALTQLGFAPGSVVDWSRPPGGAKGAGAFNWQAFLAFIEALLPIILPFLKP